MSKHIAITILVFVLVFVLVVVLLIVVVVVCCRHNRGFVASLYQSITRALTIPRRATSQSIA